MNDLVSEEAREWIGKSDDPIEVEVTRRDIIKYSVATEQILDKYTKVNLNIVLSTFKLIYNKKQTTKMMLIIGKEYFLNHLTIL